MIAEHVLRCAHGHLITKKALSQLASLGVINHLATMNACSTVYAKIVTEYFPKEAALVMHTMYYQSTTTKAHSAWNGNLHKCWFSSSLFSQTCFYCLNPFFTDTKRLACTWNYSTYVMHKVVGSGYSPHDPVSLCQNHFPPKMSEEFINVQTDVAHADL